MRVAARRSGLLAAMLIAVCATTTAKAAGVAERGANWLLSQQAADGGWHSTTYGTMHSGVGNTALVLNAFARMPKSWRKAHLAEIARGIRFLLNNLDHDGYLTAPRQSADFPTYATALLVASLEGSNRGELRSDCARMRKYLVTAQRTDAGPAFGGWGQVGGEMDDARLESNINISVTRYALEALASENGDPLVRQRALKFLEKCRNASDGGYYFIPIDDNPLNKAGATKSGIPRSYGTATADGLLGLLACGVRKNDDRVQGALKWLERHHSLNQVPGYPSDGSPVAHANTALKFYYFAAIARVMEEFPESKLAAERESLHAELQRLQHTDGSWSNPNTVMREDDPLIATAFAIQAMATLDAMRETAPSK